MWDAKSYISEWARGYYGDELESIRLVNESQFIDDLKFLSISQEESILNLIKREYGYIDKKLHGKKFKLDIIEKDKIFFPQKSHYEKIPNLSYYSDEYYKLPRGIVIKDGDYYIVLDGYHRITNTKIDIVEVIVAY